MSAWAALVLFSASSMPAMGDAVAVPSGMPVTFHDMIWDEPVGAGLIYRFRFVAPEIGGDAPRPFSEVSGDMDLLCQDYALPRLSELGPRPSRVMISLMAAPVEFGVASPDVIQYFEAYSVSDDRCIWEAF
ncbi:acetolactate synthase [bacterium]|nr:acetolactate synthase [bacterium]